VVFAKNFEDLEVFKLAFKNSLKIHKATLNFPKTEQFELASQLRRCTKSICANIAEGFGKQVTSKAEYKRFLNMALGSCSETRLWLRYCFELGYINKNDYLEYREFYLQIGKMLTKLKTNSK